MQLQSLDSRALFCSKLKSVSRSEQTWHLFCNHRVCDRSVRCIRLLDFCNPKDLIRVKVITGHSWPEHFKLKRNQRLVTKNSGCTNRAESWKEDKRQTIDLTHEWKLDNCWLRYLKKYLARKLFEDQEELKDTTAYYFKQFNKQQ